MRRSRTFIFLGSTLLFLLSSTLLSGSSYSRSLQEKKQAQANSTNSDDSKEPTYKYDQESEDKNL